jgi:hypothetical protein
MAEERSTLAQHVLWRIINRSKQVSKCSSVWRKKDASCSNP